jgi:hypothetical protein
MVWPTAPTTGVGTGVAVGSAWGTDGAADGDGGDPQAAAATASTTLAMRLRPIRARIAQEDSSSSYAVEYDSAPRRRRRGG